MERNHLVRSLQYLTVCGEQSWAELLEDLAECSGLSPVEAIDDLQVGLCVVRLSSVLQCQTGRRI